MDVRKKDAAGNTICPQCRKAYKPILGERKRPDMNIQDEFPNALSWQREQLITGICSDECWSKYLGIEEEEEDDYDDEWW